MGPRPTSLTKDRGRLPLSPEPGSNIERTRVYYCLATWFGYDVLERSSNPIKCMAAKSKAVLLAWYTYYTG